MTAPTPSNGWVLFSGSLLDVNGNLMSPTTGPGVQIAGGSLGVTQPAGAKNPSSAINGYLDTGSLGLTPTLLHAITANSVAAGIVQSGTTTPGVAGDSRLCKVIIPAAATAITLTVAGFMGEDGTARNWVITGPTSGSPLVIDLGAGLVNSAAPMTLTASVADSVLVSTRPA